MRYANGGRLNDIWVPHEDILDVGGEHVDSARLDHVLDAPANVDIPIVVHVAHVAAFEVCSPLWTHPYQRGCTSRILVIALHQSGTPAGDLAGFPARQDGVLLVKDFNVPAKNREPDRAMLAKHF